MADANLQETLEEIERSIANEEAKIKRGEALERMVRTDDFQLVITEGYLEAEAERLFAILTTPPGNRKDVLDTTHDKLSALRHFKEYIGTETYPGIVRREAENAPDAIAQNIEYRGELTSPSEDEV